eukprot:2229278-Amphidinium_carterae.1
MALALEAEFLPAAREHESRCAAAEDYCKYSFPLHSFSTTKLLLQFGMFGTHCLNHASAGIIALNPDGCRLL